jgi:K+-sensing histidine kinase KdpD
MPTASDPRKHSAPHIVHQRPRHISRVMRDLLTLISLPGVWVDSQPDEIVENLTDILIQMVHSDLIYVRIYPAITNSNNTPLELVGMPGGLLKGQQAHAIGSVFEPWLKMNTSGIVLSVGDPLSDNDLHFVVTPIGYTALHGYLVVGSYSEDPLTEMNRILIRVAANLAMTALQQSKLLNELRAANRDDAANLITEQAARAKAEEANTIKLRFLAMIVHELRTPLTAIKGFTSTLLATDTQFDSEEQNSFLRIIDEETDRLTELIEQLLDVSRLQSGTLRIHAAYQPLGAILEAARPRLEMLTKVHLLRMDIPRELPFVLADSQRIIQVLSNLVHNAAKFAPPHTTIHVIVMPHEAHVEIDVCDQGPGIPLEARANLFDAFRQLEQSDDTHRGAGLGLCICKGIVEGHGGTIWINDAPPPGTTICFTLPVAMP